METYWILESIASLLLIVGFTRILTARVAWNIWYLATYTMVGLAGAAFLLYLTYPKFHIELLVVGAAVVVGLTWTGLTQENAKLPASGHLTSVAIAAALAGVLALLAIYYQWWIAPAIILGLFAISFVRDFIFIPIVNRYRRRKRLPPIQWNIDSDAGLESRTEGGPSARAPPRGAGRVGGGPSPTKPAATTAPKPKPAPVTKASPLASIAPPKPRVPIRCPKCGTKGRLPKHQLGLKLRCPKCATQFVSVEAPGDPA